MHWNRLLGAYTRSSFLVWLAWRSFGFTLTANQAVPPLIGLAVWTAAAPGAEMASYYVVLLFVRLMTVSYENHTFSERIYSGDLADDLLRPHPVVLQPLGENVAIRIWHVIIALPLLLLVTWLAPVRVAWSDLALAFPALVLAAVIRFLYTYTLALSAFWTERAHSVVGMGSTLLFLLGGEAAPVAVLPGGVRAWAEALPFRAMMGFPAELAVGRLPAGAVAVGFMWQLVWLVVFGLLARAVWQAGVRRYTVVGG